MIINEIAQLGLYIIGSVGGAGIIIVAVARWWAKYLADSLLEGERSHHRKELEKLKRELEATNRQFQSELDKTVHAFKAKLQIEIHAILDLWKKTSEVQTTMQVLRPELSIVHYTGDKETDKENQEKELSEKFKAFVNAYNELLDAYRAQSAFITEDYVRHIDLILQTSSTEMKQIQLSDEHDREWFQEGANNYKIVEEEIRSLSKTIRHRLDELVLVERQNV